MLPKIIKPSVTRNQTMCSFTVSCGIFFCICNLTTVLICTDTLIVLDSPLCEGVFRSENLVYQKNQTAEMDFLGTVRIV